MKINVIHMLLLLSIQIFLYKDFFSKDLYALDIKNCFYYLRPSINYKINVNVNKIEKSKEKQS